MLLKDPGQESAHTPVLKRHKCLINQKTHSRTCIRELKQYMRCFFPLLLFVWSIGIIFIGEFWRVFRQLVSVGVDPARKVNKWNMNPKHETDNLKHIYLVCDLIPTVMLDWDRVCVADIIHHHLHRHSNRVICVIVRRWLFITCTYLIATAAAFITANGTATNKPGSPKTRSETLHQRYSKKNSAVKPLIASKIKVLFI